MHAKTIVVESAIIYMSPQDTSGRTSTSIEYDEKLSTVSITFPEDLPLGPSCRLALSFTGILNDAMCGFYRSRYTDSDGKTQFMASTQFEALDARRAFPCWDEPAVKAMFNVSLVVPEELTAVGNMPEKITKILPGGLKRVVFDRTPIMSTYLVAFAVGRFDFIQGFTKNGVSMRVFTQPGRVDQVRFALDVGLRCLQFLDEYFQIPYPLPKCDMMSVTEFAAGAMENWGLVTYREAAVLLNEATAEVKMKQRVAMVICHELAHQWFGNLVTMNWVYKLENSLNTYRRKHHLYDKSFQFFK
jgi:aminopeptidase N